MKIIKIQVLKSELDIIRVRRSPLFCLCLSFSHLYTHICSSCEALYVLTTFRYIHIWMTGDPMESSTATPCTLCNGVPGGGLPPPSSITPPEDALLDGKTQYISFSAKTCLELLPQLSEEQLDYEVNVFQKTMDFDFGFRRKPSTTTKQSALDSALIEQLKSDMDFFVKKPTNDRSSITNNISRLICEAETLQQQLLSITTDTPTTHTTTQYTLLHSQVLFHFLRRYVLLMT